MRIGIVCYPTVGGSGVVATELGHSLAKAGHDVHFITYEVPFRLRIDDPLVHFHKVEINRYDLFEYPDYALTLAVKIAEVSKQNKLDVLHVHYAIPHATSAYLARQLLQNCHPKIITTLHGTDITLVGQDPAYTEIVKFSMEHSDRITAVSESLATTTKKFFRIEKPITVIPNFFSPNPKLIGEKPMRASFAPNGEKLLCHSSNFRSVKRIEDVIRIFSKVRTEIPSKLLLLGTGPEIEIAHALSKELRLREDIFFLGKLVDIDPYIASSDLLLLPSTQESFGLVALEAMSYGVPVIATSVGGVPEVVRDGKDGFLSDAFDIAKMADDAILLLSDPKLYEKMSLSAMSSAQKRFSVEKILPKYLEIYS